MDVKFSVFVVAALTAVAYGLPAPQNQPGNSQNYVPGVFISSDTLKDLQEKAQKNQPITNPTNQGVNGNLKVSNYQPSEDKAIGRQDQPISTSSGSVIAVQPATNSASIVVDTSSQIVSNAQPQPSIVTIPNNQPSSILVSQPSNQPVIISSLSQPATSPSQPIVVSQPATSANNLIVKQPSNQPLYISQPSNQPLYVTQPSNQPLFVSQPNQLLVNSQPGNQAVWLSSSNQPTLVYQNGQPAYVNNPGNQVTLVSQPSNSLQNPGTVYAVVPVNNGQGVSNVNGNGNSFLVPSNQVYAINTGR